MKKRLRVLAALLATVMCVTACGNDTGNKGSSSSSSQPKESQAASEEKQDEPKMYWEMLDEVSDTSELPDWTGEKLEITVWVAGGTDALFGEISDTNVVYKEIERVTGVVINAEDSFTNGGDTIDAKLPKVIASGDLPTMIYGYNIDSQVQELYNRGYLADLTEYYENGSLDHVLYWLPLEEMEDLLYSHLRGEDGKLFLLPQVDGIAYQMAAGYSVPELDQEFYTRYGVTPRSQANVTTGYGLYVRDDVLKAVRPEALTGAEIKEIYMENGSFTEEQIYDLKLETMEDFVDLLKDIKAELAKGDYKAANGEEMEVTYGPNSEADNWDWMNSLNAMIGGFTTDYFTMLTRENAENGTMFTWSFKDDLYVDYMKTLNGLVREDIISQNSLVDNATIFMEKIKNGHYAVTYSKPMTSYVPEGVDWQYRPVWVDLEYDVTVPLEGIGTLAYYGIFKDSVPEGQMDQLIHYIDYINSMIGRNLLFYGPASAGLFTVDEDGNRTYTDPELEACMVNNEDNGANVKYGLHHQSTSQQSFKNCWPYVVYETQLCPNYKNKANVERTEKRAFTYFNPGTLSGKSWAENVVKIDNDYTFYGIGLNVESIAEFWTARAGFENQMKKTIVAASDAEFDTQLQALWDYAEEFGLTDEALKEYNALVMETNYNSFKAAGFVD